MSFPVLQMGELIAQLPIIQGGMGIGISLSGLAVAVANEGGIGVIASAGIGQQNSFKVKTSNSNALSYELRHAKSLTSGIIGVNAMVALSDYLMVVKTAIVERSDIIFSGAGLPLELADKFRKVCDEVKEQIKTKLVPIVSSARAAKIICQKWLNNADYLPDAVVVEGPKAGGHLGFSLKHLADSNYALETLVPQVVEVLKPFENKAGRAIPVIAAGGISRGEDIRRFLQLGAAGIQMGTRFIATDECDADYRLKLALVNSGMNDTAIIQSPVGMPGRAIKNEFIETIAREGKIAFECPFHCLKTCSPATSPYCITNALLNAVRGKLNKAIIFSGTNAGSINNIVSVRQLMMTLYEQYSFDKQVKHIGHIQN